MAAVQVEHAGQRRWTTIWQTTAFRRLQEHLQDFVDDMSNWYVRRSRERFWAKGMEQDKINAYMTLYTALVTVCKAAAPMIPFMTEDIYQNLVQQSWIKTAPESIHLCDFPVVNEERDRQGAGERTWTRS